MTKTQRFDELNNYFGEMEITSDQKKKRVEIADAFVVLFMYVFENIKQKLEKREYIDEQAIISMIDVRYNDVLASCGVDTDILPSDMQNYSTKLAESLVEVTTKHIIPIETTAEGDIVQAIDTEYFLSEERAMTIAKNEANSVYNAVEFQDAVEQGYTMKSWVTMHDELVRDTHNKADGQTIDINEMFKVGNSEMPYPRSPLGSANETVNCRCTVEYS